MDFVLLGLNLGGMMLTDWQIGVVLTRRPRLIEALKLNG